jgi:hypothetical protein
MFLGLMLVQELLKLCSKKEDRVEIFPSISRIMENSDALDPTSHLKDQGGMF